MTNPNEEVIRRTYPRLISDLTKQERKSVEEWIRVLPKVFRECEGYLREYEANKTTVFKLLQSMNMVIRAVGDARNDLIERHKIPDGYKAWLAPEDNPPQS